MDLTGSPELEALLHRAMDAARAVLAEQQLYVERACMFAIVNRPGDDDEGVRIGASFPQGDSLASSSLASEAAIAYSVKAALEALRPDGPDHIQLDWTGES